MAPAQPGMSFPQDFTFDTSGENVAVAPVEPDDRSEPPVDQGASQGLLDRKEVLGGKQEKADWPGGRGGHPQMLPVLRSPLSVGGGRC